MARPKLYNSDQPFLVRSVLRLYEFLASLKLAVVLIFTLAAVLAFATFLESNVGTSAARWYIYHTKKFSALLLLLGVCIFCAASIRYPWKRHQTGFVITHIGLLTLLAGSAISFRGSLNSQMLVFLNDSSQTAIDQDYGFLVFDNLPGHPGPLHYRLQPGPFNWDDQRPYELTRRLKSWIGLDDPSQSWQHSPELIYEHEGTKVEVVDFYSRSEVRRVPYLGLAFRQPAMEMEMPVNLEYDSDFGAARSDFGGLGSIMMWMTDSKKEFKAFTACIPQKTVEKEGDGAVAIWTNDEEVHHLSIAALRKFKKDGEPYRLNDKLTVELVKYVPSVDFGMLRVVNKLVSNGDEPTMPAVELKVRETIGDKTKEYQVIRFAKLPFLPRKGEQPDNFVAEFYHPQVGGRVEILQGPDGKLAFRAWQQKQGRVVAQGDLKQDEPVDTWSMGGGKNVWQMTLKRHVMPTSDDEQIRVIPLEFDKGDRGISKRVKIRVSWLDQKSGKQQQDEFWLKQNLPEPWDSLEHAQIHRTLLSDDEDSEPIETRFLVRQTDVGFAVKLVNFDLDVDPGTRMAANYTSHLVQVDVRNQPEILALRKKLKATSDPAAKQEIREELMIARDEAYQQHLEKLANRELSPSEIDSIVEGDEFLNSHIVTMNQPLDYPDADGRVLRFFQENYLPPDSAANTDLGSIFRVNYDPGRPIKYLGSLLITIGIFSMFYMRAYFFKTNQKVSSRGGSTVAETIPDKEKSPVRSG